MLIAGVPVALCSGVTDRYFVTRGKGLNIAILIEIAELRRRAGQRRRQDHVIAREERGHFAPRCVRRSNCFDVLNAALTDLPATPLPKRDAPDDGDGDNGAGPIRFSKRLWLPASIAGRHNVSDTQRSPGARRS